MNTRIAERQRKAELRLISRNKAARIQREEHRTRELYPRGSGLFDLLDDAVIRVILSFVLASDLCRVSRLCRALNTISQDFELWKGIYLREFKLNAIGANLLSEIDVETSKWKAMYMNKARKKRMSRFASYTTRQKKFMRFGKLPDTKPLIEYLDLSFDVELDGNRQLLDWKGKCRVFPSSVVFKSLPPLDSDENDPYKNNTSSSVSSRYEQASRNTRASQKHRDEWKSNNNRAARTRHGQGFTARHRFFESIRVLARSSTLMRSVPIIDYSNTEKLTPRLIQKSSQDCLNSFSLYDLAECSSIVFGVLDGRVVFVVCSLPHTQILSQFHQALGLKPLHTMICDDVDSQYGLHDFTLQLVVRNSGRILFSETQQKLFVSSQANGADTYQVYGSSSCIAQGSSLVRVPVRTKSDKVELKMAPNYPWKTQFSVFRGSCPNVCVVDYILWDEHFQPIAAGSQTINLIEGENVMDCSSARQEMSEQFDSLSFDSDQGRFNDERSDHLMRRLIKCPLIGLSPPTSFTHDSSSVNCVRKPSSNVQKARRRIRPNDGRGSTRARSRRVARVIDGKDEGKHSCPNPSPPLLSVASPISQHAGYLKLTLEIPNDQTGSNTSTSRMGTQTEQRRLQDGGRARGRGRRRGRGEKRGGRKGRENAHVLDTSGFACASSSPLAIACILTVNMELELEFIDKMFGTEYAPRILG